MRAKLLLAAAAIALLAGTAAASAQDANIRIQSRDFRSSNDLGNHGYYGRGYGAYGYYMGPHYRYRHWRHW